MDPTRIALFDLADERLAWAANRESVLAQNIANADTPGWRARDVQQFDATLSAFAIPPTRTNPMHLSGTVLQPSVGSAAASGERAPDGNAVSVERELVKIADTDTAHAMTTDLYKAYLGMFRTAIGR